MTAAPELFPFFTSFEEVRKLYGEDGFNCIVMSADQFMPMLQKAKADIMGLVINPAGVNAAFPTKFLESFYASYKQGGKPGLQQNQLNAGDQLFLKNPSGEEVQAIETALISGGFHDPKIKSIYFKERLIKADEKNPQTNWFILIDASEKDTGIFERLSKLVQPAAGSKKIEFMFADSKLGQNITSTSKPIYVKSILN